METHQVRYFLVLARTLNFTKAAEECNVTQPSLTRAVKRLEEELGGPLFHRERANTHLTELGRAMLPHIEQSYLAAQSARALAEAFRRGDIAPLRLGFTNSVSSRLFTDVLQGVRSGVPNFELAVEAIFDDNPRRSGLIFAVHMWAPNGPEPDSIAKVLARQKDLHMRAARPVTSRVRSSCTRCVTSSANLRKSCLPKSR